MTVLEQIRVPVVLAPMAGGPSTPELAAAVCDAGGLGFLAAGYLTAEQLNEQVGAVAARPGRLFGVNLFSPGSMPSSVAGVTARAAAVEAYRLAIGPLAAAQGIELGPPRSDDDHYAAKVDVVVERRPAVVSFTFGCPDAAVVDRLHAAGIEVWVTVTDAAEAAAAVAAGADAVVAQGGEAGRHRGSFLDDDEAPLALQPLIDEIRTQAPPIPIIATGGLMTGAHVRQVLDAGAVAAQLGTAFLLCPEAGTNVAHRRAVRSSAPTVLTRAFTGRLARGIVNTWSSGVGTEAPSAYPEIHHITAPLRAYGRSVADADLVNLWAGTRHALARPLLATEVVNLIARDLAEGA